MRAAAAWPEARRARPLAATPARERARRRIVALVFVVYLLVIFEGALRKWVLPQYGTYIFFIRDPVALAAYALAFRYGWWPRGSRLLRICWAMAVAGALLALIQAATGGYSEWRLILSIYGWRSYFFYAPLACLVGATFTQADLMRVYKLTLWLAIPIAVLVAAQFFSPPGAAINVGISDDAEFQFHGLTATYERTRPMGPFSSGAGQQQFVATAFAIVLGLLVARRIPDAPGLPMLAVFSAAVLSCAALSGSRGTVLQCAVSMVFAAAYGLIGRNARERGRALAWTLGLAVAVVTLYPVVFPEAFASFTQRWTTAAAVESSSGGIAARALIGLIDFVRLIDVVPPLGYGLGYGGNASITLGAKVDGVMPGYLAETDFSRHMVDLGPLLGLGYIVFRLALAAWLVARVLQATRRRAGPMPMLLLSYVALVMVLGTLTGQGAINLYGWLYTGLLIAITRPPTRPSPRPSPRPPAVVRPTLRSTHGNQR